MSEYNIDNEAAISSVLSGTEFDAYDAGGTSRVKKVTAAQIATYVGASAGATTLPAGTATVAPLTLTAGTNLTTAAAGASEFDGKVFYDTAVASTRQVRVDEQYCVLTTDYTATDSASAQKAFNASTNGAVTLAATTAYEFEALIWIANTGTTSHTWATLFGGTATFTNIWYNAKAHTSTGNTLTAVSEIMSTVATAVVVTAASTSATENAVVHLRGFMLINAGGTVIPQIQASAQPGASGTPGVLVKAGSFFRCWPVGTNAPTTVGNWS